MAEELAPRVASRRGFGGCEYSPPVPPPWKAEGIELLILVLPNSALRASEVLRLLIKDWRPADRGLFVRAGKGRSKHVC